MTADPRPPLDAPTSRRAHRVRAHGETAPHEGVASFLARALEQMLTEFERGLEAVRKGHDAEAVHDLRVAIRRIRTTLKVARGVFGKFHTRSVRALFTALHRATGPLRDEEVLFERFTQLGKDHPAAIALAETRARRMTSLRTKVLGVLDGPEPDRAREGLRALVALPVKKKRDVPASTFALDALDRAERQVRDHANASPSDGEALHALRIAFKHLRYAAELFSPVLDAGAHDVAKEAASFQKRLGEVHDIDVAMNTLSRVRTVPATQRQPLRDALLSAREKEIDKFLSLGVRTGRFEIRAAAHPPVHVHVNAAPASVIEDASEHTPSGSEPPHKG